MAEVNTIGLDIAKQAFQAHGSDARGNVMFRKKTVRAKVMAFFASQPRCVVALEACGGAHFWGQEIGKLGHTVRVDGSVRFGAIVTNIEILLRLLSFARTDYGQAFL